MNGLDDYRLHDTRHSHLVSSSLFLQIAGRLLGHTNPDTTNRHSHLVEGTQRTVGEAPSALAEPAQAKVRRGSAPADRSGDQLSRSRREMWHGTTVVPLFDRRLPLS